MPRLSWEAPLEKEMATHSSTLAWENPMDRGAWRGTARGVGKELDTTWRLNNDNIQAYPERFKGWQFSTRMFAINLFSFSLKVIFFSFIIILLTESIDNTELCTDKYLWLHYF